VLHAVPVAEVEEGLMISAPDKSSMGPLFAQRLAEARRALREAPRVGARDLPRLVGLNPNGTASLPVENIYASATEMLEATGKVYLHGDNVALEVGAGETLTLQRLTESLAIKIFRDYSGDRTPRNILRHFFDRAATYVKEAITDSSGQSVHVDGYLGEANSVQRRIIADSFERISRRMKNADGAKSIERWKEFFE
jgi:hypothetical protein